MRRTRFVLLALGTALLLALLWRVGPAAVISAFAALSWRLPLLLCFPACLMIACDTLGWRFSFRRDRVPFWALFSARLAGEAFNSTTPTAVGGEPVKAWLIRSYVPLAESLPSVVIAKTTITIGQTLFLLLGLLVAWPLLPPGSVILHAMRWLLVLECLGTAGFVAVQLLGPSGWAGRGLHRLGILARVDDGSTLDRIDRAFAHFYRHEPRRLALSIGWHFAGWALGVLETYLILAGLGLPVSLGTATVVDAFGAGVGFAAFLIPARLGAQEAGDVAVFVALGFGAPAGLAFTLARRLREATWAALGFATLVSRQAPLAVAPVAEPEG
jgi:hypothetical protein